MHCHYREGLLARAALRRFPRLGAARCVRIVDCEAPEASGSGSSVLSLTNKARGSQSSESGANGLGLPNSESNTAGWLGESGDDGDVALFVGGIIGSPADLTARNKIRSVAGGSS